MKEYVSESVPNSLLLRVMLKIVVGAILTLSIFLASSVFLYSRSVVAEEKVNDHLCARLSEGDSYAAVNEVLDCLEKQIRALRNREMPQDRRKFRTLKEDAENKETQEVFAPFLTAGKSNEWCHKIERPALYSLSSLNRARHLEKVESFAKFAARGCGGRPPWVYPRVEAEWHELEKRLDTFRQLAPIWVSMGLLLP